MISRADAFASAMSVPTSSPSHRSAHCADAVRRGSTTTSFAPRCTAFSRWWKKIGCASRAFEPQSTIRSAALAQLLVGAGSATGTKHRRQTDDARSVSGAVAAVDVVRAEGRRENFCAAKFNSFVALEQLKRPVIVPRSTRGAKAGGGAIERLVPARGPQLSVRHGRAVRSAWCNAEAWTNIDDARGRRSVEPVTV